MRIEQDLEKAIAADNLKQVLKGASRLAKILQDWEAALPTDASATVTSAFSEAISEMKAISSGAKPNSDGDPMPTIDRYIAETCE